MGKIGIPELLVVLRCWCSGQASHCHLGATENALHE